MALPRPDYRDPSEVAERRERERQRELAKLTCAGCTLNRLRDDAYHCELAMPDYPKLGRGSCLWWRARVRG